MKIYRAASGAIEIVPAKHRTVSLEELQRAVGGFIKAIPGTGARAYCNEEGRLRELPFNRAASRRFGQPLVGDCVELEAGEIETEEQLTARLADELRDRIDPMELILRPTSALHLAGLIQLARRHPWLRPGDRAAADRFLAGVRAYFAASPAALEVLRRGDGEGEPSEILRALAESVKLQAHYAELLNMHDGGERLIFPTVESWLERLRAPGGKR